MNEIKRWDIAALGNGSTGMKQRDDGAFVRNADHEAEVARLRAELADAHVAIESKAGWEWKKEADRLRAEVEKIRGYEVAPLEAKVAELRAEVEVGERNLAAAMDQLAESDAENAKLDTVANAARQVAAWFTSGNTIPVSGVHQMVVSSKSIMADVHVLNEALAAMGASA